MGINVRNNIVIDGLVLHLDAANRMSYSSGSNTINNLSTGGSNPLIGSIQYSNNFGGSLIFITSSITNITASVTSLSDASNFSIEFTCLPYGSVHNTAVGALVNIVNSQDLSNNNTIFVLYPFVSSDLFPNLNVYWNNTTRYNSTTGVAPVGRVSHYIVTNDGTNFIFYKEGTQVASFSSTGLTLPSNATLYLGRWPGETTPFQRWNGENQIFRIYNRALSSNEVTQNYNALKSRFNLS